MKTPNIYIRGINLLSYNIVLLNMNLDTNMPHPQFLHLKTNESMYVTSVFSMHNYHSNAPLTEPCQPDTKKKLPLRNITRW